MSVRGAFWSIFGSNLGPRLASLGRLSADFRDFLVNFGVTCDFSLLKGARGGSEDRFRVVGKPPGKDFERILDGSVRCFGRSWPSIFVIISSQVWPNSRSVVVLPSVSHPCCPAFSCRGGGLAQRVKFAVPQRGAGVVLNHCVKSPVPEGFPFLTFPAASARPPTLPVEVDMVTAFQSFCSPNALPSNKGFLPCH